MIKDDWHDAAPLTVISFYTEDWDYSLYAKRMINDCDQIGINHRIIKLSSLNCYKSNCNIKSRFILECLNEIKSPVLWMDVDGSINKIPEYMRSNEILLSDIAGYIKPWNTSFLFVATLWFNYTKKALNFLEQWQKNTSMLIDDDAFQTTMFTVDVNIKILPENDIEILRGVNDKINDICCFSHRLSLSDIKRKFKESK